MQILIGLFYVVIVTHLFTGGQKFFRKMNKKFNLKREFEKLHTKREEWMLNEREQELYKMGLRDAWSLNKEFIEK